MEDYKLRVFDEMNDLRTKVVKLKEFLDTKSDTISEDARFDLVDQYGHMCSYLHVLGRRVEKF